MPSIYPLLNPAGTKKWLRSRGPPIMTKTEILATSLVEGRDCVFTTYAPEGNVCVLLRRRTVREDTFLQTLFMPSVSGQAQRITPDSQQSTCTAGKYANAPRNPREGKRREAYEFLKRPLTRAASARNGMTNFA